MTDPLALMDEMGELVDYGDSGLWYQIPQEKFDAFRSALEAQRDELAQAHARIARLEAEIDTTIFHLRRSDHIDAVHGRKCTGQMVDALSKALAERPRQSRAALKAEALREAKEQDDE